MLDNDNDDNNNNNDINNNNNNNNNNDNDNSNTINNLILAINILQCCLALLTYGNLAATDSAAISKL
jgi:hypothetical protein